MGPTVRYCGQCDSTTSSYQSAATSKIVKCCCSSVFSHKQLWYCQMFTFVRSSDCLMDLCWNWKLNYCVIGSVLIRTYTRYNCKKWLDIQRHFYSSWLPVLLEPPMNPPGCVSCVGPSMSISLMFGLHQVEWILCSWVRSRRVGGTKACWGDVLASQPAS